MSDQQFTRGKGCNNRKLSDADRAEIVRLYTTPLPDGTWMGATSIARLFGVRHGTVYYALRLAGVASRTQSDAIRGKACKPVTRVPVGSPPACKCGCGALTVWNARKNRWNRYVTGHYTQRGEQNPAHIDGRSHLPYTEDWDEVSLAIRTRDGFTCQRCAAGTRTLHVHHIDSDKQNNASENLVTLCSSCHGTVHAEMRRGVVPECQR